MFVRSLLPFPLIPNPLAIRYCAALERFNAMRGVANNGPDSSLAHPGALPFDLCGEVCHGNNPEVCFPERQGEEGLHLRANRQRADACFNEGKTVYQTIESITRSNYPSRK